MEFLDGALGLGCGIHLDESKALGALGVLVGNNLDICHRAHAGEEIEEIALRSIVGQVSDVKPRGCHLDSLRLARFTRRARATRLLGLARDAGCCAPLMAVG